MAVAASVFWITKISGLLVKSRWVIVTWLYLSSYLVSLSDAEFMDAGCRSSSVSKDDTSLASSLIASPPLLHRSIWKHLSSQSEQDLALASAAAPNYGSVITGHSSSRLQLSNLLVKSSSMPPVSGIIAPDSVDAPSLGSQLHEPAMSPQPQVSNYCGPDMVLLQGSKGCHCVYPVKVDLLLLNASQSLNWDIFLDEFASALGLSFPQIELTNFYWITLTSLNISMNITPRTSISFSSATVSAISTSLTLHKVYLNSKSVGVGDYKLLNLTWFQPPAPSPAPVAAAPSAEAPVVPLPASNSSSTSKKRAGHTTLIILSSLGAFMLIVTTVALLIICNRSTLPEMPNLSSEDHEKLTTTHSVPIGGSLPRHTSTQFIPYEELKRATNNFEHASLLGEGGFGRVYKGVLNDGTTVAIKRLASGGQQGNKEFLVEVDMLSRLHHRNLVKLVGYYSSRESSETLLCYELVPNGNLEAWLHGHMGLDCPLDWDTRMKIALDAARGLAYLHEDSQPSVIHRDFKASNILLENNFNAKVSDFGLAKQAPEGQMNYLSTQVMGTFGYVAPEYAMTGHLLVKSDVYSYGVVLLELLTGRKPVDMLQPSGQENLVTWTWPILRNKDRLEELADPKLQGKYSKEDFVRVCTIAAACVATAANQRPTMGEVVQSLKMVQRVSENPDPPIVRPNHRRSTTNFDSDGTSTVFSSGPYSGMSTYDNDNITRTAVLSEDLHEGR